MRLKKRKPGKPGDEFLEALASGKPAAGDEPADDPAGESAAPDPGGQLAEAQMRAASAEQALQQIRDEAEGRLAEARAAIEDERRQRLELAQALSAETPPAAPQQPDAAPELAAAQERIDQARAAMQEALAATSPESRYEALDGALAILGGEAGATFHGPPAEPFDPVEMEGSQAEAWPTPWIDREDEAGAGKRRGLFSRGSG